MMAIFLISFYFFNLLASAAPSGSLLRVKLSEAYFQSLLIQKLIFSALSCKIMHLNPKFKIKSV